MTDASGSQRAGLWPVLWRLLQGTLRLVTNRFDLAAAELVMVRRRLAVTVFFAGLGVCALGLASVALSALLLMLVWEPWGMWGLLLIALIYLVVAWLLLAAAMRRVERLGLGTLLAILFTKTSGSDAS
jgi:hypothetical protein